jgi:hypothetical protein
MNGFLSSSRLNTSPVRSTAASTRRSHAASAERRPDDRRRVINIDWQRSDLTPYLHEFVEIPLPDITAADAIAGNARL